MTEFPPILKRLVHQLQTKGMNRERAIETATEALQKSGNLKPGTQEATAKGIRRGLMTPEQRAIDRASKASGHAPTAYQYNSKTNRATLKRNK